MTISAALKVKLMDQKKQHATDKFTKLTNMVHKKSLVIFAGRLGGRLLDNVKYLFRHCVLNELPFSSYFLTHFHDEHQRLVQNGLPSLLFPSDDALRILPQAKVVVTDDFWFKTETPAYRLLTEARTVQIWHGIPLKLIGFPEIESNVNMTPKKAEILKIGYSGYDAAVSTSPFVTATSLGKVFKADAIWETGYPRNDVLVREPDTLDLMGVDIDSIVRVKVLKKTGHKLVFFMPTFRDTGGDPFTEGVLDLAAMDAFGRKNKIAFLLKFHPYLSINAELGLRNVYIINSSTDAYPLLSYCDCLLTDYSSVAYDFLLTGKPLIFFPYDLQKFIAKDRGMFYQFDEMAPGPRPTNQKELFEILADVLLEGKDEYVTCRNELADRLFTHRDGNAAKRITELLVQTFFSDS